MLDSKYLIKNKYFPTIGIETHVQLKTKTKLFAAVGNDARDARPNSLISPVCVALPGTLPVLNQKAVELAIKAGLALKAEIAKVSHFDRKHYFYPDLPKGYQISQLDSPIVGKGLIEAPMEDGCTLKVRIARAHLEEDAGKNIHPNGANYSLVDLNRAGTPLLEIVSEADMHSALEARTYVRELYLLMKYADVSDVDLYHGNMRFDVNVSVSSDVKKLGVRTETKNINSFRGVEKAVEYEINRQIELLEKGQKVTQETRGWDEAKQKTISQRGKEEAHDYRYMPDPDIPPIVIDSKLVDKLAKELPLLPNTLRQKFRAFGLTGSQIDTVLDEPELADIIKYTTEAHDDKTARTISNWCLGELQRMYQQRKLKWSEVKNTLNQLVELSSMVDNGEVSSTAAKTILPDIVLKGADAQKIAEEKQLLQVSDEADLVITVQQVLNNNPKACEDIKRGEMKAIGFLVGQIMKASAGRANPKVVQQLIKKQLGL